MTMESREICGQPVGKGFISFGCTLPPGHPADEPHMAPENPPSVAAHQQWEDARRARMEDEVRARTEAAQQAADSAVGPRPQEEAGVDTADPVKTEEPVTEHQARIGAVADALVERLDLYYSDAYPIAEVVVVALDEHDRKE